MMSLNSELNWIRLTHNNLQETFPRGIKQKIVRIRALLLSMLLKKKDNLRGTEQSWSCWSDCCSKRQSILPKTCWLTSGHKKAKMLHSLETLWKEKKKKRWGWMQFEYISSSTQNVDKKVLGNRNSWCEGRKTLWKCQMTKVRSLLVTPSCTVKKAFEEPSEIVLAS